MCVLLSTTHLQLCRIEGSAFVDHVLMVDESRMHSADPQLKRQNPEWHAQISPRQKIAQSSQGAP
jgi:hypothetical protein